MLEIYTFLYLHSVSLVCEKSPQEGIERKEKISRSQFEQGSLGHGRSVKSALCYFVEAQRGFGGRLDEILAPICFLREMRDSLGGLEVNGVVVEGP